MTTGRGGIEPRIGVFVCDCGNNIGSIVNVPAVVEFARTLSGVVLVERGGWVCSTDYQETIKAQIHEQALNQVVVAACTPRTHAYLFRRTCEEAGLNKYLFEFANIREHCSWVHRDDKEAATAKAQDLVAMAVARARLLEPLEDVTLPVGQECLVVGGGIAGLTAAHTLAEMGFKVVLVEREAELGGLLRRLHRLFPQDGDAQELLKAKVQAVAKHPNVTVYTQARMENISGYLGSFCVQLRANSAPESLRVSTVIVATGLREVATTVEDEGIITQLQLEDMLRQGRLGLVRRVVMINCIGAPEEHSKCSLCRIGCGVALKNAKAIRTLYPDARVYILSQDMVLPGHEEEYLTPLLQDTGIILVRYHPDRRPQVQRQGRVRLVRVYDTLLRDTIEIPADLVVLTVALEGDPDNQELSRMLKLPLAPGHFLQEAHVKLRPLELMTDGVYLCGGAHAPKLVSDTLDQALGAAMKASIPMSRGVYTTESINAVVDRERCNGCGFCERVCPYGAPQITDKMASIVPALCWGCGACGAECPRDAIIMRHFSDEQINAQIEAALADRPEDKILAFVCNWCSYVAADFAGISRLQYSPAVRLIRVMCSGRVDRKFIHRAFHLSAGMVLVGGCLPGECHYGTGNTYCAQRMEKVKRRLPSLGIDPQRLWVDWFAATDGKRFAAAVNEMAERLAKMRHQVGSLA